MRSQPNCVAIFSGGLDSTTLVYDLVNDDHIPVCLSFDYGQKHSKELEYAERTASMLGLEHHIVDLRSLRGLLGNSSLTSEQDVPDGHYAEATMKQTVVPNRNMIMLSIATGVAVNRKLEFVATGVHAGDHFIYPDCRPEFMLAMRNAILFGNEGFHNFTDPHDPGQSDRGVIYTPYIHKTKADIAYQAMELGVPLHETWSCYKGGEKHCGTCGTCVERLEAIAEARGRWLGDPRQVPGADIYVPNDQTEYADPDYWRTVTK
jgi:7-cyano-7-deazaguanine synthase